MKLSEEKKIKWEKKKKLTKAQCLEIFDKVNTIPDISLKEIRFVAEYISNGFNAGKAFFHAVSNKMEKTGTAYNQGCAYAKRDSVKAAIALFMSDWLEEKKLKLERELIGRLSTMAFYDPSMFITPQGDPAFTDWEEIPKEYRCCIDGIKKNVHRLKDAYDVTTIEITLVDRKWAMKELLSYLKLSGLKIDLDVGLDESAQEIFQDVFGKGITRKKPITKKTKVEKATEQ